MSEEQPEQQATPESASTSTPRGATSSEARPERRGPPPNPLYHPLFLPVLLVAFTLWFGWDGFLTTDPEMQEHQTFNRIMYLVMQPICLRSVPRGIQEFLEDHQIAARERGEAAPTTPG